jgi:hypothetical protein
MTDQWTPSDEPTPPTPATFSSRTRLGRGEILRIGFVIGSLVVLVASAAVAIGASPGVATDPSSGPPSSSPGASDDHEWPGIGAPGFRFGGHGGLGGFGGIFGGPGVGGRMGGGSAGIGRSITIAKIDGSDVSLKTDDGWTRTISVTDTTEIRIGSQVGKLADLKVGDVVSLREKKNTDGTYTITLIIVRVPTIGGTVTDVSSSGFTVKLRDGSSKTVTVSGSTSFLLGSAKSSKADLSVGARVEVEGTDGTSFAADVVHIVPDVRIGKVTATTSTTITIEVRDGKTTTIHVDAATTYKVLGTTTAKLSDVTVGMYVAAQGLSRADGSLDATSVAAGTLRGHKLPVKPDASPPSS